MAASPDLRPSPPRPAPSRLVRTVYACLGAVCLVLGAVGAMLPIMPTTIFIIMAAWCFGRSSPRVEAWLLAHPLFGPALRRWREERAISRRAKWVAVCGMAGGYAMFWFGTQPQWPLALAVGLALAACAAYVVTRPEGCA